MSKRKRKQVVVPGAGVPVDPDAYDPKPGPGQVFKREPILTGKGHAQVKRYRNINASSLLLAYERGALAGPGEGKSAPLPGQITATERFDYGEKFEGWHCALHASPSRDSTIQSISAGAPRSLTEDQEHAGRQMAWVRSKMSPKNYLIVLAFCGHGCSMLDSLRYAGIAAHPVGTAFRVREALDELVSVLTGRLLVPLVVS